MRITLGPQVDMAYLYLVPIADGQVAHTEPLIIDLPGGARRLVNLDFDDQGRLLGIEFDGARAILPEPLLREARSGDITAR
jgi:uncharacterized protein YuzE